MFDLPFADGAFPVVDLHLTQTWEGLVEGAPTASQSQEMLEDLQEWLGAAYPGLPARVLLDPREAGQPLGGVRCVAVLRDFDLDLQQRTLILAWHQCVVPMPVAEFVSEATRAIVWHDLKVSGSF